MQHEANFIRVYFERQNALNLFKLVGKINHDIFTSGTLFVVSALTMELPHYWQCTVCDLMLSQACEEFRSISRKLYEKPNSIEELAEQREWMKTIPDKIAEHQVL